MSILQNVESTTFDQAAEVNISGEGLLAVTGVRSALEKQAVKVSEATLSKAISLNKVIGKKCKEFLLTPEFNKIDLNLEPIDFLELQEKIIQSYDANWLSKVIEQVPNDLKTDYSLALSNALQILKQLTPRLPVSITAAKSRPNDFEQSRFNRAFRTVNNPLSVLDDLEMGCLSRGQVATLISAYPQLYKLINETLTATGILITSKQPEFQLPYPKLKQLSVLMLSNTVPPDLQALLQENFTKQQQQQPANVPRKKLELDKQQQTPIDRLQTK